MLTEDFILPTKLYHATLAELCQPLADYLGITHVSYVNIDKQGKCFTVCTYPKWVERILEEQYYKVDPTLVNPDNIGNGFFSLDASEDKEFKDIELYDAVVNFNWCHGFGYVEKNPKGGFWSLDFATTKDNLTISNRVFNEAPIIRKALRSLQTKISALLTKDLLENRVDLAALKGDAFYKQVGILPNVSLKNKTQTLTEMEVLSAYEDEAFLRPNLLSAQEISCLRSYLDNHSSKKVASELKLTVNTVTAYLKNVKTKFNCSDKYTLIKKASILQAFGRL